MDHSPQGCPFYRDAFAVSRKRSPTQTVFYNQENIPMFLRHSDIRKAAADSDQFSSDTPFRVPIPSEEELRTVRQLPIEADPPEHKLWRAISDPFFARPKSADFQASIRRLVCDLLVASERNGKVEVVREFALPLQSKALALLLNVELDEAEEWIGWGTHVFKDGVDGVANGSRLDTYIRERLELAAKSDSGEDFFSALHQASFGDRALTEDEKVGFVNLAFAGGRDTVIQAVAGVWFLLSESPDRICFLREDPRRARLAAEEVFRVTSPLTHIGRTCKANTNFADREIPGGQLISLCWASANFDPTVFDQPESIKFERKPNPHLAFGSGIHTCQGALHARLLVRVLMEEIALRFDQLEVISAHPLVEKGHGYERVAGFDSLEIGFL